jgi:sulfur-carrier protein
MELRVFATLRDTIGGTSIFVNYAEKATIAALLEQAFEQHPQFKPAVVDGDGRLQSQILIFINGRDIRYLQGLETTVQADDLIRIFPPVGGGC